MKKLDVVEEILSMLAILAIASIESVIDGCKTAIMFLYLAAIITIAPKVSKDCG